MPATPASGTSSTESPGGLATSTAAGSAGKSFFDVRTCRMLRLCTGMINFVVSKQGPAGAGRGRPKAFGGRRVFGLRHAAALDEPQVRFLRTLNSLPYIT